eukprot:COSAG04_NODE_5407_length_1629_cov_1.370588_1_plen_97_part_10
MVLYVVVHALKVSAESASRLSPGPCRNSRVREPNGFALRHLNGVRFSGLRVSLIDRTITVSSAPAAAPAYQPPSRLRTTMAAPSRGPTRPAAETKIC